MHLLLVALALISVAASYGQRPVFIEEEFQGRDAYVLENTKMRVTALRGAGHIAEIRLKSQDPAKNVNPMRIPHYPTIEPWEYNPSKHDQIYGSDASRILMSGYMGHLLNFPNFGAPSEEEIRAGLVTHGEALAVAWEKERVDKTPEAVSLWYTAHLPKSQFNAGRTLTLASGETVLQVEEWIENLVDFDRPVHWVQHATFGPPFVEPGKTVLDASATKGMVRRDDNSPKDTLKSGEVAWPEGTSYDGKKVGLREMQTRPNAGTYYALLMDPKREESFFTMYHKDHRLLIGYIWKTKDFPWLGDWQENHSNTQVPWEGKVVARGMEFGTTPFGGPMKEVVKEGEIFGTPVYRWVAGRERATTRYLLFLTEIPDGFQGVEDVRREDGKIHVTERQTGKTITIASSGNM